MRNKSLQGHRTPKNKEEVKLSKPAEVSVGFKAILSSLQHMRSFMDMPDALRASLKMNQKGGFDCPGCAWPDPDDERSSIGEYCENGIKALAEEATKKRIDADFFRNHAIEELQQWTDYKLGKSGRLAEPMYLAKGSSHYEPISWDNAFAKIANKLKALDSPNDAIFYTSGRTSNEAAFLYQLLVRAYGTNNMPDCSNMCHESSGVGLSETVGIGKGSVTLQDIHEAELLIIMGQNPGTNHPRMLNALEKCKENGGKIISVNPLVEAGLIKYKNPQRVTKMLGGGTHLTDLYLPVRINGDVAFLKAVMYLLLEWEEERGNIIDKKFIEEYTDGYEVFSKTIKATDFERCVSNSGLEKAAIIQAAEWIAAKEKIIICWAMGLTQHVNGVDNIKEIVNLLLLRGAIGKPGSGTCPVRGHSNVQGDRTMGIWEAPKDAFLDKLEEIFGIEAPREHGYAVVSAIKAMHENKASFFMGMGGNFLSATPDTDFTAEALENCDMTVQVSTKLNRSHLITGKEALILPCLGRTEIDLQKGGYQFVSVENSMGIVHSSKGVLEPASDKLRSEVSIVCGIANKLLEDNSIKWQEFVDDYDIIRDVIARAVPGFSNYNVKVRVPKGFYLPNGARDRKFNTATGKARFSITQLPENKLPTDQYVMMTIRSHDQYNTTIYGNDDRYRGIYNARRVVLMNEQDIKAEGWAKGDHVNVSSHYQGKKRLVQDFVIVPYRIPTRCVAMYFPEANPLVPIDLFAHKSHTPASKKILVTIVKENA
jgi:molybdopterin-dependent oxidoreductase alpha subunit